MVLVVQNIHQVGVKRVHVVKFRKLVQDGRQLVMEVLLRVFHFSCVECSDSRDLVVSV